MAAASMAWCKVRNDRCEVRSEKAAAAREDGSVPEWRDGTEKVRPFREWFVTRRSEAVEGPTNRIKEGKKAESGAK